MDDCFLVILGINCPHLWGRNESIYSSSRALDRRNFVRLRLTYPISDIDSQTYLSCNGAGVYHQGLNLIMCSYFLINSRTISDQFRNIYVSHSHSRNNSFSRYVNLFSHNKWFVLCKTHNRKITTEANYPGLNNPSALRREQARPL